MTARTAADRTTVPAPAPAATDTGRPDPAPPPAPAAAAETRLVARPVTDAQPEAPTRREPEPEVGPTVVVEIDRIEVRLAPAPAAPERRPATRSTPGPSLDDYLRDRSAGERRPA